jgi:heme oxygenase
MIGEGVHAALRAGTRDAHARLELRLGLLDGPPSKARFVRALQGFHAFHRAWEPRAAASVGDPAFLEPRRRTAAVRRDLKALGAEPLQVSPDLAATGVDDPVAVWGGVYVVEGSTLGGKLIARALAEADWAPPGGLKTFDPYGDEAARQWADCRARLNGFAEENVGLMVAAARGTFACLEALCTEPLVKAAA